MQRKEISVEQQGETLPGVYIPLFPIKFNANPYPPAEGGNLQSSELFNAPKQVS